MRRLWLLTLGLVVVALTSCAGEAPNSGVGERIGAKGRIVGYLYDADTGAPLSGATVETVELGEKVTATTAEGYFTLDRLTASGTYRVTFSGAGFVTRVTNIGISQVPADAYDAVSVANAGNIAMVKPSGTVKGRIEFASQQSGQPIAIANANIIVDYQGTFALTKSTTSNAQGDFTLDGLPASPTGQNATVCAYNISDGSDAVADFVPTCANATVYSNQTTPLFLRPNRYDLNNGEINIVQGVVRDVLTRLPVEGVEVFELGKESEKVTTDANGFYFLKTTSVNRFCQYVYRKTGYAEGYAEFTQGRGGNNTTNMTLYPGGASIEGRLYYANLQPAANAEVRLDLRSGNLSNGFNVQQLVKTDGQGNFTLMNLPGAIDGLSARLNVTPWTADPDLFPETRPQFFDVVLYPNVKTPLFAQLLSNTTFAVVASNVPSGFIPPTEPVTFQLTLPSVPAENSFTLTDGNSGQTMPFTVAYADGNRRITVTPAGLPANAPLWSESRSYTLTYRLRANNSQTSLLQSSFSFTPRTSLAGANIATGLTSVTLENPEVDATTRNLTLRWAPLPDAFSYAVYVRTQNTNRVPSYVRLGTTGGAAQAPSFSMNLPNPIGASLEPIAGQPFANGQVLTFLVVPIDSRGIESDATKGATLNVRDVTPPRIEFGIAQLDGASGPSHPIRFVVRATEVMDRAQPPTTTLPSGLAFTSWVVDELSNGLEGTLTLTGSLSAVANLSLQPRDTSGNLGRATTIPVLQSALVPNQNFEGDSAGTCSASSWTIEPFVNCAGCTQLALSSQPSATVAIPGTQSAFDGTCSLGFGDADNLWCGTQQAWAPMDLAGTTFDRRSLNFQFRFWTSWSSSFAVPSVRCDFFDTTANATLSNYLSTTINGYTPRTWNLASSSLTPLLGRTGRVRCFLETGNCGGVRGSLQLDDFRVYMK